MRPVVVHYHIFKNAGSTIDHILQQTFGERWASYDQTHPDGRITLGELTRFIEENSEIEAISSHQAKPPVPVIDGIVVLPMLLLRHPLDRARSVYDFERRQGLELGPVSKGADHASRLSFADYLLWRFDSTQNGVVHNYQTAWLCSGTRNLLDGKIRDVDLSVAKASIKALPAFGIVERFDESLSWFDRVFREFGVTLDVSYQVANVSRGRDADLETRLQRMRDLLGESVWGQLVQRNEWDMKLYDFSVRLFSKKEGTALSRANVMAASGPLPHLLSARPRSRSLKQLNARAAMEEARHYAEELVRINVVGAVTEELANFGERNLQSVRKEHLLRGHLLEDIRNKRPFSLVRLGDGEGNILFWGKYKSKYPRLARHCAESIWRIMFGRVRASDGLWDALYQGVSKAFRNAAYVGFPTFEQTSERLKQLCEAKDQGFDLRGVTGTVVVWDWYNSASKRQFRAGQTVLRGHVHVGILRFYGDLIRSAKNVSVITCYGDLLSLLHDTFGVSAGESLLIPPQAQNIKGTADAIHFPDRYRAIVSELRARKRVGELFFVGAGLVGKLYCEEIRKAGGMAIDVGSLMDVWMGIGARQYQGNGFVEKYSLTPRQADVRAQSTAAS